MRIFDIEGIKIPSAALELLLRMAKTLVRDAPEQLNETLALARLVAHIEVSTGRRTKLDDEVG